MINRKRKRINQVIKIKAIWKLLITEKGIENIETEEKGQEKLGTENIIRGKGEIGGNLRDHKKELIRQVHLMTVINLLPQLHLLINIIEFLF
jgi:hypothetical protein